MSSLEERLIDKIHPGISDLWAVADSDGLFRSDEVYRLLAERGAEIFVYEDPIAFRYRYEHEIRPRLESGGAGFNVIIFEPGQDGFRCLPADVYESSRRLEVALGDVFPMLSRRVLTELEPAVLSRLWEKRDQLPSAVVGDRETADFVLRIGYRIEPAFIGSFQDLIPVLIELHFTGRQLPDFLAGRLEQVVGSAYSHPANLRHLVRNPAGFWQFLQGRWEKWLKRDDQSDIHDLAGPAITFDESRVRSWMDNLFHDGFLVPVHAQRVKSPLPAAWCRVGVASGQTGIAIADLVAQRGRLIAEIPGETSSYQDWLRFALRYSLHVAETFSQDLDAGETSAFWADLWEPVNTRFDAFVHLKLESLCNLPPSRPVLVHHVAKFLSRRVRAGKKVALLVLDGLSLAQWKVLRRELESSLPQLLVAEDACFTMVPSVTNVCRQTIYSGELPVFFDSSIERTDCDAKRWRDFWDSACGRPTRCVHLNVEGRASDLAAVGEAISSGPAAFGMTVRMPDEIVHGAKMGWRGITEQLKLWARAGFISEAIRTLLDAGYQIFLTSDHGNIEAIGGGAPSQGVLVDRSGQRVRVYREQVILDRTILDLAGRGVPWRGKMLPSGYLPLLHGGRGAFVPAGQMAVCHGGASLDELVVPFIELSSAKKP